MTIDQSEALACATIRIPSTYSLLREAVMLPNATTHKYLVHTACSERLWCFLSAHVHHNDKKPSLAWENQKPKNRAWTCITCSHWIRTYRHKVTTAVRKYPREGGRGYWWSKGWRRKGRLKCATHGYNPIGIKTEIGNGKPEMILRGET